MDSINVFNVHECELVCLHIFLYQCLCVSSYMCVCTSLCNVQECALALCECAWSVLLVSLSFFNSVNDVVRLGSVFWTREASPTSVRKVKYILAEIHTSLCVDASRTDASTKFLAQL